MDCCLCSSVVSIFRPPRNTICPSCYEGARCILALSYSLDAIQDANHHQGKSRIAPQKGLAQAFNELKQLKQMGDTLHMKHSFLESLVTAFQRGMHTDVELVPTDGPSIHAHRVVMAAKSPVFRDIFEVDECKREHVGPLHIPDMTHSELRCFVEFLYSGNIPQEQVEEHAHALYVAADKYDIPFLSKICETHILNSINPSNVLDVLELASLSAASSLKDMAINSIIKHRDEIIFSDKYKEFALRNALMSLEITKALLRDMKSKAHVQS